MSDGPRRQLLRPDAYVPLNGGLVAQCRTTAGVRDFQFGSLRLQAGQSVTRAGRCLGEGRVDTEPRPALIMGECSVEPLRSVGDEVHALTSGCVEPALEEPPGDSSAAVGLCHGDQGQMSLYLTIALDVGEADYEISLDRDHCGHSGCGQDSMRPLRVVRKRSPPLVRTQLDDAREMFCRVQGCLHC